jgi:hypothetical protein
MNKILKIGLVIVCIISSFVFGYNTGKDEKRPSVYVSEKQGDANSVIGGNIYARNHAYSRNSDIMLNPTCRNASVFMEKTYSNANPAVNYDRLDKIMNDLRSDEPKDAISAINVLAEIGSPMIINAIRELIYDTNQDADVRAAAIKALKWNDNPYDLMNIFQGANESELLVAAIEAADEANYENATAENFANLFLDAFQRLDNAEMRIAIIDYFINKPKMLSKLFSFDIPLSSGVLNHIDEIQNDKAEL